METSVYVDLYFNEESVFTLNICATRIWPLSCSLHESKGLNTQQRRGNRKGYSLNILSNLLSLSLLSLGPSVQTEQQQPLQFLTGSLRRFQLYSLWKRLDIQIPSVYFVGTCLFFNSDLFYQPAMMPHFCHRFKYLMLHKSQGCSFSLFPLYLCAGTLFLNVRLLLSTNSSS